MVISFIRVQGGSYPVHACNCTTSRLPEPNVFPMP
jgi:hypothetical protein